MNFNAPTQEYLVFALLFAVLVFLLLLWRLLRTRKKRERIERDRSGLWRYHKDTQYKRKEAYQNALLQRESEKKSAKPKPPKKKKDKDEDAKVIVTLAFDGDLRAKQHNAFANLVDEIVLNEKHIEEVVVRITSGGGTVPHYGHVFAEMERIRASGVKLTVCIDVIAASGGYLMALPAHNIIAAPFSVVGSVGVMAFVPNVRQLLLKHDVNPRTFYAGKFKRTVSMFDQATPEEQGHFQEQLEYIHRMLKDAVVKYRPKAKLEEIETGDHWTAHESMERELGLVDSLGTASDYLLQRNKEIDVVYLETKRSVWDERFGSFATSAVDRLETRLLQWSNGY